MSKVDIKRRVEIANKIKQNAEKKGIFEKELPVQNKNQYKVFLLKSNNKPLVCIILSNVNEIVIQLTTNIAKQHESMLIQKGPKAIGKFVKEIFRICGEQGYLPEIRLKKKFTPQDEKTSGFVLRKHISYKNFYFFDFQQDLLKMVLNQMYLLEYFLQDILNLTDKDRSIKQHYGDTPSFYT